MKHNLIKSIFILSIVAIVFSCNKFSKTPIKEAVLDPIVPNYFAETPNFFDSTKNNIIHLGRVLFYDKNLSINNAISCASCHKQQFAFADNVAQSRGFQNALTKRNSIALQNIITSNFNVFPPTTTSSLFWDGREAGLTTLIDKPLANHIEMGMENPTLLLQKLNNIPYYKNLVEKAYGTNNILDIERLTTSIAAFVQQINSNNCLLDESMKQNSTTHLNTLQMHGQKLFTNIYNCSSCHTIPTFMYYGSDRFIDIGLEINKIDKGRKNVTNNATDEGKFKVPDLHNVALTAPYMHDGRYKTLDEVLEHYSQNIKQSPTLDFRLQNLDGSPKAFNIKPEDKIALIAFLNTLTDNKMINNPNLSSPFKY